MSRIRGSLWLVLLGCCSFFAGAQVLEVDAQQQQALEIELYRLAEIAGELSDPVAARLVLNDRNQRVLTLPVSGTIEQLSVLPGATVAMGAELGMIHSREALALQREYLGAQDRLERSHASKQRDQSLYEGGVISKKRWQQTRAEWGQREAMVKELSSQLAALGFSRDELDQLRKTREIRTQLPLRAPMSGVVLDRLVQPGEAFDAGQELYHVGDVGELWLAIHAPPGLAAAARAGDAVYSGEQVLGRLLQVGAAVEQDSRSVLMTAEVTATETGLLPGQSLLVWLLFEDRRGLWLPRDSLVSIGGEQVVFVATEHGFDVRSVTAVPAQGGWTALAGVEAGERIAGSGTAALKGMVMGLGGAASHGN